MIQTILAVCVVTLALHGCGAVRAVTSSDVDSSPARQRAISRARVWMPTDVSAMNLKAGPSDPGAFPFLETVECTYYEEDFGGASPKFACRVPPDDRLKVKYGGTNAEVYAEVAATRLLWVLGFGADRMYPVRVVCRGCPREFAGIARTDDVFVFDPAVVEREMPGHDFPGESGWAWPELDAIEERAGGSPRAHVDALKLLAVFLQHTDTKPDNQRLICLDAAPAAAQAAGNGGKTDTTCQRPFMLMQDVGLTFGAANALNTNDKGMSLADWSAAPVWKEGTRCVGNLPRSLTGTLQDPVISEEGRAFLARLLVQLSDAQLRDLFEAARVHLRLRDPDDAQSGFAAVDEWVSAFKQKRQAIVDRRC